VGYLGDTDGNQAYNTRDVVLLQNVVAGRDTGFGAWSLTDPTVVGDVTTGPGLNVRDVLRLLQQVTLVNANPTASLPEFPPIPTGTFSLLALTTESAPAAAQRSVAAPTTTAMVPGVEVSGAQVNWSGSFAPANLPPAVTPTVEVPATSAATDWMTAPWARDLSERLASTHAQAEGSRTAFPGRELLRTLSRAFARR
jgi:hypothetical protein